MIQRLVQREVSSVLLLHFSDLLQLCTNLSHIPVDPLEGIHMGIQNTTNLCNLKEILALSLKILNGREFLVGNKSLETLAKLFGSNFLNIIFINY